MAKILSNNPDIEIEFPEKRWNEYLAKIGKDDKAVLNYVDVNKILIFTYNDFIVGKNSLDDLAEICNYLLNLLSIKEKTNSELGRVLLAGGELSFYIRDIKTKEDKFVSGFMMELREYVEKIGGYGETK